MNPFNDMRREELAGEISKAIAVLEARERLNVAQRAEFAERLRYLLIVAASRLSGSEGRPGSPAFEVARAPSTDPIEAYAAWIDRETASARYTALQEVGEKVMSPVLLGRWIADRRDSIATDAGWRSAMAALLAMKPAHRGR